MTAKTIYRMKRPIQLNIQSYQEEKAFSVAYLTFQLATTGGSIAQLSCFVWPAPFSVPIIKHSCHVPDLKDFRIFFSSMPSQLYLAKVIWLSTILQFKRKTLE